MKVISILTQDVDSDGRVLSYSKTSYKKGVKPTIEKTSDLFQIMDPKISEHTSRSEGVERFIVTISTTKGTFIKTYKAESIIGKKESITEKANREFSGLSNENSRSR